MAEMVEPNNQNANQQNNGMVEHHASVTVKAPLVQVYQLFTHFHDFPKYMHFVDEVTYIDNQRSHWVAEVAGHHEWDAINQDWVENQQIGWRSYNGLENEGKVTFQPVAQDETRVDVYIAYKPPVGFIGEIAEKMGVGSKFEHDLQHDLVNFASMVEATPRQQMDPTESAYLYNSDSAAAQKNATPPQVETMGSDYQNDINAFPTARPVLDQDIINEPDTGPGGGNVTGQPGVVKDASEADTLPPELMEGGLTGQPKESDDVIVEVYEVDTLPASGGTPMRGGETVEMPPPNPTNIFMPPEGTVRPVMPGESEVNNPVMPPARGPANPVMPPSGDATNPVMPPESGEKNPVMPPERQD